MWFYENFVAPDYDLAPYEEGYDSYGYAKAKPVASNQQEHKYSNQYLNDGNEVLDSETNKYQSARPALVSVVKKEIPALVSVVKKEIPALVSVVKKEIQAKLVNCKDIVLLILFVFFNLIVYLFYFLNYGVLVDVLH